MGPKQTKEDKKKIEALRARPHYRASVPAPPPFDYDWPTGPEQAFPNPQNASHASLPILKTLLRHSNNSDFNLSTIAIISLVCQDWYKLSWDDEVWVPFLPPGFKPPKAKPTRICCHHLWFNSMDLPWGWEKKRHQGYAYLEDSDSLKIGMFGSSGVGKTAIVLRATFGTFVDGYDPVQESCQQASVRLHGLKKVADFLDMVEHSEAMEIQQQNISQCLIFVYSISDKNSFTKACQKIEACRANVFAPQKIKACGHREPPFFLIGNKCDLPDDQRQVTKEDAKQEAKKLEVGWMETSAKEGIKIEYLIRLGVEMGLMYMTRLQYKEVIRRGD